jgi:probable poly-beta-1,6-N-acetyl-D-glucosamine export protein
MFKNKDKRDYAMDILRVLAIFAVIMIHTTTRTIQASNNDLNDFSFTLFLNQIFRFAVPMFFIVSGYVLEFNYRSVPYHTFIKKRLGKIFIPYLFWSLVYYFFIFKNPSESFIREIISGDASYQLYFIPALFLFYLIFPFLHKIYSNISGILVVTLLATLQISFLAYDYYVKPFRLFYPVSVVLLNYFAFLLGMIFVHKKAVIGSAIGKYKYLVSAVILLFGVGIYLEGKDRYLSTSNYLSFYSSWRPSVIIYSILLTVVLYYFLRNFKMVKRLIKKLSEISFFVYFIHVAVLTYVWEIVGLQLFLALKGNDLGRIFFDPIFFMMVASLSFGIGFLIRKIPFLSRITG